MPRVGFLTYPALTGVRHSKRCRQGLPFAYSGDRAGNPKGPAHYKGPQLGESVVVRSWEGLWVWAMGHSFGLPPVSFSMANFGQPRPVGGEEIKPPGKWRTFLSRLVFIANVSRCDHMYMTEVNSNNSAR